MFRSYPNSKNTYQSNTNKPQFRYSPGCLNMFLWIYLHFTIQLQVDIPIPWDSEMWTSGCVFGWGPWPLVEPCSWAWTSVLPGMGIRRKNLTHWGIRFRKGKQKDVRNTWVPGWWQLKYFLFSPLLLGKMNPFWRSYFSDGLVKNHQPEKDVFERHGEPPCHPGKPPGGLKFGVETGSPQKTCRSKPQGVALDV